MTRSKSSTSRLPIDCGDGSFAIPLTRGMVAYVDAADVPLVSAHLWYAHKGEYTWYAYRKAWVDGQTHTIRMHRVIAGTPDGLVTDHKDGDGLNNRRSNLRTCTNAENIRNTRKRVDNVSGYRGVSRHSQTGRWVVHISGQHVGVFDDPEEAARAYDEAAREAFGQFARLNFP